MTLRVASRLHEEDSSRSWQGEDTEAIVDVVPQVVPGGPSPDRLPCFHLLFAESRETLL